MRAASTGFGACINGSIAPRSAATSSTEATSGGAATTNTPTDDGTAGIRCHSMSERRTTGLRVPHHGTYKTVPMADMGDPKTALHYYLQQSRDSLVWKLDGLSEREARLPRTPTGNNF